ncbi:transposase [Actinokineospora pegani]|nr:transposase [Actinokineospora pegani]
MNDEIGVVFAESRRTYGYRRVHAALARASTRAPSWCGR